MKLLTLADGFGDSVATPVWYRDFLKWPEIIKLMTRGLDVVNLSRYGAGNEYIVQCLRNNISNKDVVLIQWSIPNRLDLVLSGETQFWQQQISNDAVYNNNVITINADQYWISNASENKHVVEYHQKYISTRQHQLRSQLFVDYAKLLLEQHDLKYGFLLTWDSAYLKETVTNFEHWLWHEPFAGMQSFRKISFYEELDSTLNLVQPISLVQFDFIKQFIMPTLDLGWRSKKDIDRVENILYQKYKQALDTKNDSN
jgi:hypothetical protein